MESAKAKIARSARYAQFYAPLVLENIEQLRTKPKENGKCS